MYYANCQQLVTCACKFPALGAPQLASLIHVQDNEKQTTLWKNANDMKKALNFQYPVLPEDKDHPMPEKTLNINGRIDLSRQTRQSSDDPAPTPPRKRMIKKRATLSRLCHSRCILCYQCSIARLLVVCKPTIFGEHKQGWHRSRGSETDT